MDEDLIEELLDIGVPERHAFAVEQWHVELVKEARAEATVDTAWRILEWLLSPLPKLWSARSKAVGLAFAIGRPDLAGYKTLDEAGRGEGVSHATVANWSKGALEAIKGVPRKESF
jgi:hypothetical protein